MTQSDFLMTVNALTLHERFAFRSTYFTWNPRGGADPRLGLEAALPPPFNVGDVDKNIVVSELCFFRCLIFAKKSVEYLKNAGGKRSASPRSNSI